MRPDFSDCHPLAVCCAGAAEGQLPWRPADDSPTAYGSASHAALRRIVVDQCFVLSAGAFLAIIGFALELQLWGCCLDALVRLFGRRHFKWVDHTRQNPATSLSDFRWARRDFRPSVHGIGSTTGFLFLGARVVRTRGKFVRASPAFPIHGRLTGIIGAEASRDTKH